MPMLVRRLALDGASRHQMTVVEWVERAIRNQARIEERDEVYPPDASPMSHRADQQQLPVVFNPSVPATIEHEPAPVQERQENLPAYIELLRMLHDTGAAPEATTDLAKALVKAAKARLKRAGEA
jgi:hypothetical protein